MGRGVVSNMSVVVDMMKLCMIFARHQRELGVKEREESGAG